MNKNSFVFLYAGSRIYAEYFISDIITITDKDKKEMNILVFYPKLNNQEDNNNNLDNSKIKSKEVICPNCFEQSKIKIKNYKIFLSECKNGHLVDDIIFKNFEKTQKIDLKDIKCNICNKKIELILLKMNFINVLLAIKIYVKNVDLTTKNCII